MKRWRVPVTVVCLLASGVARGDIPGGHSPRPMPYWSPPPQALVTVGSRTAVLVVKKDDKARKTCLVLPADLVTGNAPPQDVGAARNLPTIMAGLALTAAFVSGGFCLVRKKRGVAVVALIASVVVLGCSAAKNKVVPAPEPPPTVTVTLPATVQLDGKLILDVVGGQGDVELIVPSASVVDAKP
jgi:hypothetical protein